LLDDKLICKVFYYSDSERRHLKHIIGEVKEEAILSFDSDGNNFISVDIICEKSIPKDLIKEILVLEDIDTIIVENGHIKFTACLPRDIGPILS